MWTVPGKPLPPTSLPGSAAGQLSTPPGRARDLSSCTPTSKRGFPSGPVSHLAPAGTTVRRGA